MLNTPCKYAIQYLTYNGENWTYTSCGDFEDSNEAIGHFFEAVPEGRIICYFKIRLK